MARLPRIVVPGYPHHVTQRGVRSLEVFHCDGDRHAYLSFLSTEAVRFDVDILAWCLMTDHVHFIAVPGRETSLARAFGEAHRRYTRMKNSSQGVNGYLFQGRFASCVLDEQHLIAAIRFVALNPVLAGLVETPWEYRWSSARFLTGVTRSDPLVKNSRIKGLVTDWRAFLSRVDGAEAERLRYATRTGRPAGNEKFIAEVENVTGRDLRMKSPGRPRKSG